MGTAIESLRERPISLNLICKVHSVLLAGVRGRYKGRERFRRVQNRIGRRGCSIEEAAFVPPQPMTVMEHLSNLEKYVHFEEQDRLVQLAVVHARLELIHPFVDGDGRLGRIPISSFLYEKGLLSSPMFYISAYLEANRENYYERLWSISAEMDLPG